MSHSTRTLLGLVTIAALAACSETKNPSDVTSPNFDRASGLATAAAARVCPAAPEGSARCHAWVVVDAQGSPLVTTAPSGFFPADLQSAYGLSATGSGGTVAIVDAYDDPSAEADLGVYRAQFGLPACTTANGCFKKVNQNGGSTPPRANASWGQEISLDLDMVSAICPGCHILLVEASSASLVNLGTAVNTAAATPGVVAISNSYGGPEYSSETSDENTYYNHPGVAVTVSSGDSGYGVEFPAASRFVTAVGGTHLTKSGTSWSETVWSGAGSGCSAYVGKPSWQTDTGCAHRTVADVSAVADPNTGVAVYDSYAYQGRKGWLKFGGTSVASPIIGAVYALAGNTGSVNYGSYAYSHTSSLFDITSGSNGSCGSSYLCTGKAGFDGPTGLGSPRGTGAF
jgi:subtilase family serine protease